eukprot:5809298-Alexandrium_andersonii.AAC.1
MTGGRLLSKAAAGGMQRRPGGRNHYKLLGAANGSTPWVHPSRARLARARARTGRSLSWNLRAAGPCLLGSPAGLLAVRHRAGCQPRSGPVTGRLTHGPIALLPAIRHGGHRGPPIVAGAALLSLRGRGLS